MNNTAFLASILMPVKDEAGACGLVMHYAFVFAIVGSSLLAFFYFWSKGKLDMDEEPKLRMLQEQEEETRGK